VAKMSEYTPLPDAVQHIQFSLSFILSIYFISVYFISLWAHSCRSARGDEIIGVFRRMFVVELMSFRGQCSKK